MPHLAAANCAAACCSTCRGWPVCGPGPRSTRGRGSCRRSRRQRMVVSKRMTEANEQDTNEHEQDQKRLTLRSGGTLGLRRPIETGQVRQSFSHGRSKAVTVEVRKKRVVVPGAAEPGRPEAVPAVAHGQPATAPSPSPAEEHATRVRVLQDARKADEDSRRRAALAEAESRRQQEERAEEEARLRAEEEVRRRSEEEESKKRTVEESKKRVEEQEALRKEE